MDGYAGKMVFADLSAGTVTIKPTPPELKKQYLGGRGFCIRLLNEPLKEGAPAGQVWRREEMLDKYYTLRGWDMEGMPTKEKLKELGLA
ncbi:MAG: hypothetical protein NTZ39_06190 [Methanoregula sp.]|nr:hypothetical protein [Methanoregula sp.]MCX6691499.1 hypothetical protein [Methanoregula sp.]